MQQRGIELSQLFRSHNHLRAALLEKMPPMQITRNSDDRGENTSPGDSDSLGLMENGLDDMTNDNIMHSKSVRIIKEVK